MRAINKQQSNNTYDPPFGKLQCYVCKDYTIFGKIVLSGAPVVHTEVWTCDDCVDDIYGGQFDPDLQSDVYQLSFGV